MASIQEKIQDAAARNAELLEGLHETRAAPSQLYQQISYISDLDSQLKRTETHAANLKRKTEQELKDHKKYSESTFRRLAHKASGRKDKFEEKAAKEEREYFDAIQAQKTAEDDLAYARQLKAEAENTKAQHEVQAQRHDQLQAELDALYNSIFAGHTPGFPEEDAKEQTVDEASRRCSETHQALEKNKHIVHILRQLQQKLIEARGHLDAAHSMSTYDVFGGGTMSSMMKRNSLECAESSMSQVRMLQEQIRQVNPAVGDLGPMNIASGSIWGDVVFDNIFSDMDMHDKIKDSERQVDRALAKLAQQMNEADNRVKVVEGDLRSASETLQEARKELQKARENAFRRVIGGERIDESVGARPSDDWTPEAPPEEAPPAYSA